MGAYFVYAFFIFIAIAIALTVWNDWKEGKLRKKEYMQRQALMVQQQESLGSNIPLVKNIGTRDLFLDTLTKLGCQYQLGEGEDNRIFFAYQGEHFFADTTNDIKYVHLWDTHWGHVDLYRSRRTLRWCR